MGRFKENLDAISNFMSRLGVFEIGIFIVLFAGAWVLLDKVVFPDVDLSLGAIIRDVKSAFDVGVTNG